MIKMKTLSLKIKDRDLNLRILNELLGKNLSCDDIHTLQAFAIQYARQFCEESNIPEVRNALRDIEKAFAGIPR
jgi:Mg2+/Co2+ transporter CorB